jgi:hypothetical protein
LAIRKATRNKIAAREDNETHFANGDGRHRMKREKKALINSAIGELPLILLFAMVRAMETLIAIPPNIGFDMLAIPYLINSWMNAFSERNCLS